MGSALGLLGFMLLLVLLPGCAPQLSQTYLPTDELDAFSEAGAAPLDTQWWTAFNDSSLNRLVNQALQGNYDLGATWYQLQTAQAVLTREQSSLLPAIEFSSRTALNRPVPDFAGGENTQLGISVSYELDLWGRIRAGIEGQRYRTQASALDLQAAAMSVSAEVALSWYRLVATRQQLNLVEQQIETNESIVRLIRARFGSGQIRAVDILRQTQLLEATREQQILLETDLAVFQHQLAVLMGQQPQAVVLPRADTLPSLPPLPTTGLPLELVRRRPDLQRAHRLLQAADRDMAVAVTNKYPRLSFFTSIQLRANSFENLFRDWAYSLAGNLLQPIFYGRRLNAEVDRTEAAKYQQLYAYGQTVLTAFQEVEDALIREQQQARRVQVIQNRLDLSKKTYEQLQVEFNNGLSGYLDVLLALDQEQQLRRNLIDARGELLEFRIGLYRALGGGIDLPSPRAPLTQTAKSD